MVSLGRPAKSRDQILRPPEAGPTGARKHLANVDYFRVEMSTFGLLHHPAISGLFEKSLCNPLRG